MSTPATGLLPPRWRNQARDVDRTAERYCVLHLLLRALQPQPSLLDCVGDEFLSIQARARTRQPRGNSWHESTEIENPTKNGDEELHNDQLQGVPDWLQEFRHGLADESDPDTETLPVLLTNYLQSREQKWYLVSITSSLTSGRTENAISA